MWLAEQWSGLPNHEALAKGAREYEYLSRHMRINIRTTSLDWQCLSPHQLVARLNGDLKKPNVGDPDGICRTKTCSRLPLDLPHVSCHFKLMGDC